MLFRVDEATKKPTRHLYHITKARMRQLAMGAVPGPSVDAIVLIMTSQGWQTAL